VKSCCGSFFQFLEASDYAQLGHGGYLKGLLKPFKGKGELEQFAGYFANLREDLITLAQRRVAQGQTHPLKLLPVTLKAQAKEGGRTLLRWRNTDHSRMGMELWAQLVSDPKTPQCMIPALYGLERERIVLNLQVSLLSTLIRQFKECAEKMAQAEGVYQARMTSR
jgi:hypothetical protein